MARGFGTARGGESLFCPAAPIPGSPICPRQYSPTEALAVNLAEGRSGWRGGGRSICSPPGPRHESGQSWQRTGQRLLRPAPSDPLLAEAPLAPSPLEPRSLSAGLRAAAAEWAGDLVAPYCGFR